MTDVPITTFPVDLFDADGFEWDITDDGDINDGTNDAFDGGFRWNDYNPAGSNPVLTDGREVNLGFTQLTGAAAGLEGARSIYVSDTKGYARILDTITNTTAADITYTYTLSTNLGSDSGTQVIASGDGTTTFETGDTYLTTDDASTSTGDPTVTHVFHDGSLTPDTATGLPGEVIVTYTVTIPAGESVSFLSFGFQNDNPADAAAQVTDFENNLPDYIEGLTGEELAQVANFDFTPTPGTFGDIDGTAGNDVIVGTEGNDDFDGNGGSDAIFGLGGNDDLEVGEDVGSSPFEFDGGLGNDTLRLDGDFNPIFDLRNSTFTDVEGLEIDQIISSAPTATVHINAAQFIFGTLETMWENAAGNEVQIYMDTLSDFDLSSLSFPNGDVGGIWDDNDRIVITGDDDAETITGSNRNDTIDGNGGADTLNGGAGADIINGGAGHDTINGGDGDDVLDGGTGQDTVNGEGGNDIITLANGGIFVSEVTNGGAGVDTLVISGFSGNVGTIDLAAGTWTAFTPSGSHTNFENFDGSDNSGPMSVIGTSGANVLTTGSGDDTIDGGDGDDVIEGGAGADTLTGGNGIDTLSYESSVEGVTVDLNNQTATGGDASSGGVDDAISGFENFIGGAGDDVVTANGVSGAVHTVEGRAGNDTIAFIDSDYFADVDGGDDTDTIDFSNYTYRGLDVNLASELFDLNDPEVDEHAIINVENVTGSGLDDVITGDDGVNVLNGGDGDDTLSGGAGNDTIRGQAGTDTLVVTGNFADYTITDNGDGSFEMVHNDHGIDGTDTIVSIEFVEYADGIAAFGASGGDINLTENADTFTGTAAGETINALGGNDLINAGDGDDIVNGGDGNDNLRGDAGADTLNGGFGADILRGGAGADTLFGGAGADVADYSTSGGAVGVTVNLTTGINTGGDAEGDMLSFIDRVTGSSRPDDITGNARNNYLRGLAGDDVLTGVSGTNLLQGDGGADQHIGGTGTDWAVYVSSAALTVNLLDTTQNTGDAIGDTYSSIENLQGSRNDDSLTGDNANNFIRGDIGDDDLFGLDGDDFLRGDAGADDLFGGTGNDWAYYAASNGAVTIDLSGAVASTGGHAAGDTFDSIERAFGSAFGDSITGTDGANFLRGFFGNDTLSGGDGADLLQGDGGADTLSGGAGSDTASYFSSTATGGLTISLADTSLNTGEAAGDVYNSIENLLGTRFDDILFGDAGDNILRGSLGDDTLNGGGGNDTLRGESGADTFVFEVGGGNDIVIDWSDAEDMLDLSGFGFADVAAAMINAAQVGSDVVFTIGSDSITIEDTTTTDIMDNLIL